MNWTTLVSCEDLAAHLGERELRIVDARFVLAGGDADAGQRVWRESHLPGAAYVDLDRDLSDHSKPASEGRHPLPAADAFCATLERLGVTTDCQVVVYDAADGAMAAARFWWLMRLLGHARVAVLDGGFARWSALGLSVDSNASPVTRGSYNARYDTTQIAGVEEVMQAIASPAGRLLDARAPERFRGDVEPLDRVAGHIPGALNRPYADNLADGRFRPAQVLQRAFNALLHGYGSDEAILSCGSGVTACHNLLAMEHAGLHGARVYAGSWSAWVSDASRPVATGS